MMPGTVVNVGGIDYTMPPFNIGHWERMEQADSDAKDGEMLTVSALLKRGGPILASNLRRNYPDLDESAFMDSLDLPAFTELRLAAQAVRRTTPQQAPVSPSTGAT